MADQASKELFDALSHVQPGPKVLYMPGHTHSAIGRHGVLDRETRLIQKPFSLQSLSQKVRDVLDSQGAPGPQGDPPHARPSYHS